MDTSSEAARVARALGTLSGGSDESASSFHEPATVEAAGKALAARVSHLRPELVLTSDEWRDVLLGHVVARQLGARTTHVYDAQGTVELSGPLTPGVRCILVAPAFVQPNSVRAALGAVRHHRGEVVAVACVSTTHVLEQEVPVGLPVIDLAEA